MQERTLAKPEIAPVAARSRVDSIDLLRGLVMALMALDHTRDYFANFGFNPRDVTDPALFLTRWITHFCAPTFIFLAGLSAWLHGRGKSTAELSRFLVTRGLWLILLEFTLIQFAWSFSPGLPTTIGGGIIWVIGACMVLMAALVHLPRWALAALALALIAGHNLFDGVRAADLDAASGLWHVLHQQGRIPLGGGVSFFVLYPIVPWIGVMAAGYVLGPVMQRPPQERQRLLFSLGAAITVGFVLLRATNLYGDPDPWIVQDTTLATVLSFINCEKYPPSLLYLMMTLGPALMLLAAFEHVRGRVADWLRVFGQVPFFFYVVHIYLIHALAVLTVFVLSGAFALNQPVGFGLPGVYAAWIVVLLLLYPLCRWFMDLRQSRSEWWWRYL